jgi:DNA-directed RNA polymerase specialized sigma24 family protein
LEHNRRERIARDYHDQLAKEEIIDPNGGDPYSDLSDRLLRDEINAVVERLPLQSRTAFYLFYRAGYSGKEGAAAMNITEANFFMRLKAARDRVRQRLRARGLR